MPLSHIHVSLPLSLPSPLSLKKKKKNKKGKVLSDPDSSELGPWLEKTGFESRGYWAVLILANHVNSGHLCFLFNKMEVTTVPLLGSGVTIK